MVFIACLVLCLKSVCLSLMKSMERPQICFTIDMAHVIMCVCVHSDCPECGGGNLVDRVMLIKSWR